MQPINIIMIITETRNSLSAGLSLCLIKILYEYN